MAGHGGVSKFMQASTKQASAMIVFATRKAATAYRRQAFARGPTNWYQKAAGKMNATRKAPVLPRMDHITEMLFINMLSNSDVERSAAVKVHRRRGEGSAALRCKVSSLGTKVSTASSLLPCAVMTRVS
eukprot:CAMPEP_0198600104 /NCGR_PEP_ID=MMETSP1462-20131121/147802_1 /TAXON_ID=1333877 /ORGANISM="Brandtodinium nutriculum, Strain RCC3387" /LENGTH=128 /DNA_ID=CAMNT_0044331807 /DNA_START=149 /DNA_END=532 /DNA_ORIENTATION=+